MDSQNNLKSIWSKIFWEFFFVLLPANVCFGMIFSVLLLLKRLIFNSHNPISMQAIHFDHSTNLAGSKNEEAPIVSAPNSYSIQLLLSNNGIPRNSLFSAVKKAMELFTEAGVNVRHHFKKIFVVNEDASATYVDWVLTQRALDLILKHCLVFRISPRIVVN